YETKVRELRENLSRLDLLLSRHNFYDCQTVLALRHPESKRRALLFQADMDVDADGSDGDRVPAGNGVSPTFKPFTSFRWGKKSNRPNPYLPGIEERLRRVELEQKTATPERRRELKNAVTELSDEINTMKKYSYLIGTYDPFIVVPASFTKGSDGAHVGDYALVIVGSTIYPAIVGDVGPNDRVGEASLRIAKEVNALFNPNNRPLSELKATYIVFNGTADPTWGPPDLEKLQARCEALVKEIGGASVPLHHWVNTVPPLPTPTPTPTPTPSPTMSPSVSPTSSPFFSETPSPTSPPLIHPTFAFPTPTISPSLGLAWRDGSLGSRGLGGSAGCEPAVRGSLSRTDFSPQIELVKGHSARRPNAAGWQPALPTVIPHRLKAVTINTWPPCLTRIGQHEGFSDFAQGDSLRRFGERAGEPFDRFAKRFDAQTKRLVMHRHDETRAGCVRHCDSLFGRGMGPDPRIISANAHDR